MEKLIFDKFLNLYYKFLKYLSIFFIFVTFFSNNAKAFFENQTKYQFENKWLTMLNDISPKNRFKAMRVFLVNPKLGLPILRNSIDNFKKGNTPREVLALIGMLGDSSDLLNLLEIWKKLLVKNRSEVLLGAMERIYLQQRVPVVVKPKLKKLSVNFIGKDEKKNAFIEYHIKNASRYPIFLKVKINFWKTNSKENIPSEFLWLKSAGLEKSLIKTKLVPSEHTKNIRIDFRIFEIGSNNELLHQTIKVSI